MTIIERLSTALADRYQIERQLGQGGMATVFLAQDRKHDRKVALKVLRPELAAVLGAERFVVEIKTTAALQHPHILPLFDSGSADGFLYYVMPYIEGETLRAKLDRERQLGVDQAVKIAVEVADALDYAHRRGVIHRDIKPENILLHDGRPMVADFGIALAVSAAAGGRMTETGLSLGTPHYMSPEQATAEKEITARSDMYSLGSVLYEMLTGEPPHMGNSAQQIIMKIIADTPRPVTELRKSVPPHVAAAVGKALEKLPADRFESARALASALTDPHFTTAVVQTAASARRDRYTWERWLRDPRSWTVLAAVVALAGLSVFRATSPARDTGSETIRFTITGPRDTSLIAMVPTLGRPLFGAAVAPDRRHVAFGTLKSSGPTIYVRAVNSFELLEVPGEGFFFSPTGTTLGFLRRAEVWTLDLAQRVFTRLGEIPEPRVDFNAAVWHPDGRILLAGTRGLWSLPARGGDPVFLLAADSSAGEQFREIGLLPDGRLLVSAATRDGPRVEVMSPEATNRVRIVPGAELATMVEDILLFRHAGRQLGQLRATRFDLRRLKPVGDPIALPDNFALRLGPSIAWINREDLGNLEPVWVSRDGRATPVGLPVGSYRWPRVSPSGGRVVIGVEDPVIMWHTISVVDRAGSAPTPLAGHSEPVWSADGRLVFMASGDLPTGGLVAQVADGSRPADTLLVLNNADSWPTSASPDGRWLAYYGYTAEVGSDTDLADPSDLYVLDLRTRQTRRLRLPGGQRGARFSPDGRWLAYQSRESGRLEVHVRPWPGLDAGFLVSTGGGTEPVWSPDGRELYYRRQSELLAVAISVREGAIARAPARVLFAGTFSHDPSGDQSYDVAPDGRFLMLRPVAGGRVSVQVALNWIAEVRARLERGQ